MKKPKANQSPKTQLAAFRKAARELGADEFDERFKETLRTLAKHKPQPQASKKKKAAT